MNLEDGGRMYIEVDAWVIMDMGKTRGDQYAYEVHTNMNLRDRRVRQLKRMNPGRTYQILKTKVYVELAG